MRPDPAQRARLEEIRDNLEASIIEAKREGWLGEAESLQVSYGGVKDKLTQIDATLQRKAAATDDSHPRAWLRHRELLLVADGITTAERFLTIAPATATNKTGPAFPKAWAAADQFNLL